MTTIRLPNDRSKRATVTDEQPPSWERFKLYRIGSMLARKTGETHQRCPKRETHMLHHCLELQTGQRIRVCWRDFIDWASTGQAQKVHLRSPQAIHYARMAETGRLTWPDAMRAISDLDPIAEGAESAEVVSR